MYAACRKLTKRVALKKKVFSIQNIYVKVTKKMKSEIETVKKTLN